MIDLTQDADENLARRLREEMNHLNESWSHIVSSTKVYSQNIQVRRMKLKRSKYKRVDYVSTKDMLSSVISSSLLKEDLFFEEYSRLIDYFSFD